MQKTGNYYLSVVTHTAGRPIASDQVKDGGRWTTGGGVLGILGGLIRTPPPPRGRGCKLMTQPIFWMHKTDPGPFFGSNYLAGTVF